MLLITSDLSPNLKVLRIYNPHGRSVIYSEIFDRNHRKYEVQKWKPEVLMRMAFPRGINDIYKEFTVISTEKTFKDIYMWMLLYLEENFDDDLLMDTFYLLGMID